MSEPSREREIVVPEPAGSARARWAWAGVAWVALMLAIPLRYYLGDDRYDERFAWRMFSAVRVESCAVDAREDRGRGPERLAIMEVLPAPWAALLERNRPAVVGRFLAWRCDDEGVRSVTLTSACRDAAGTPRPTVTRTMDCASRAVRTETASPSEAPR